MCFEENGRATWHRKSRSSSEGRMEMGLVKQQAGKEQAAMSPCASLLSNAMPKQFDRNEELARCNRWQKGESALEMVR